QGHYLPPHYVMIPSLTLNLCLLIKPNSITWVLAQQKSCNGAVLTTQTISGRPLFITGQTPNLVVPAALTVMVRKYLPASTTSLLHTLMLQHFLSISP